MKTADFNLLREATAQRALSGEGATKAKCSLKRQTVKHAGRFANPVANGAFKGRGRKRKASGRFENSPVGLRIWGSGSLRVFKASSFKGN
jgi:hypothetical protein